MVCLRNSNNNEKKLIRGCAQTFDWDCALRVRRNCGFVSRAITVLFELFFPFISSSINTTLPTMFMYSSGHTNVYLLMEYIRRLFDTL